MPRIKVIIPTYNSAKWIVKTISSVLAQSFSDYDLIIFDDASADNTVNIIDSIKDARLRLVVSPVNLGKTNDHPIKNVQHYVSDCDFFKVLHHDDVLYPDCLKSQLEAMENYPNVGLVSSKFRLLINGRATNFYRKAYPSGLHEDNKKLLRDLILKGQIFGGPSQNLIRSEAFRDYHRELNIPFLTEAAWWGFIFNQGYGFYMDDRVFSTYNIHQGMNTLNLYKKINIYDGYAQLLQRYGTDCGLKDNFTTRARIRLMRLKPEFSYRVTKAIVRIHSIYGNRTKQA